MECLVSEQVDVWFEGGGGGMRFVEDHIDNILEEDDLNMVRYFFGSEGWVVGGEVGLWEGEGFGASEDVGGIFIFVLADGAGGGVGSMGMEQKAIGGPFAPECFEKVGVFWRGECFFNASEIKLGDWGDFAFWSL